MSHMIENNQFVYVGQPAWHGLGTEVDPGTTGEQMLKVAGLDFFIQRRFLGMTTSQPNQLVTEPLKEFRAIVRSDNDHVFQVASDRYQPVQNQEIVEFFREYCEAGHARMETLGALRDGAVIWALARLNGGSTATLGGVDELRGYMLLATSHDGSLRTIGQPTQTRVVCHNTLRAALGSKSEHTFSMRHTRKFSDAVRDEARSVMGMAIQQIQQMNSLAAQLAQVTIDESGWLEFMGKLMGSQDAVINPKTAELTRVASDIQAATISSPGSNLSTARGTLWGALNGVTYYADHTARSRSQQNRVFSSWFGVGDKLKSDAAVAAVQLAGISL